MKRRILAVAACLAVSGLAWSLLAHDPPERQRVRRAWHGQPPSHQHGPAGWSTAQTPEGLAAPSGAPSGHPAQLSAQRLEPTGKFRLRCVDVTCLVATQACCDGRDGARCVPREEACPRLANRYECDETADCAAGQRCCIGNRLATCVEGACVEGQRQLCSDDSECATGSCWMGAKCAKPTGGRLQMPDLPKPDRP